MAEYEIAGRHTPLALNLHPGAPAPAPAPAPVRQEDVLRMGRRQLTPDEQMMIERGGGAPDPLIAQARAADQRFDEIGLPPAAEHHISAQALHRQADALESSANQKVTMRFDDPTYAPTKRFTGAMLGRGAPQLEAARARLDEIGELVQAAQASGDDALLADALSAHADAARDYQAAEQQFAPGLLNEQSEAQREVYDAEAEAARRAAEGMREQAFAAEDIYQQSVRHEEERGERLRAQQDAMQRAVSAEREAFTKLKEAEAYDPNRWFADKSTAGKIGAVLAMMLGGVGAGLSGRPEMAAMIKDRLVMPEVEKQKERYHRLGDVADGARQVSGAEQSLYASIMAQVQDERQADLIVQQAMLEKVKADAEAMLAEAGVTQLTAEHRASMNLIDQQIAQTRMQLEIMAETAQPYIYRSAYALPDHERSSRLREAGQMREFANRTGQHGWDLQKDVDIDRPKEERSMLADIDKQRRTQVHKEVSTHADKVSKLEATVTTGRDLLDMPNLRGQGFGGRLGSMADPEEAAYVEDQLKTLGIDPTDYATEKGLRGAIKSKMAEAQGEIDSANRRLSPEGHEAYWEREKRRNPARMSGGGGNRAGVKVEN